ncbi:hypothetical protein BHE74_00058067 [Ensete ventricosum]|nr:hypothetical protein BHE74_00058067 [Ensete ventricosum]
MFRRLLTPRSRRSAATGLLTLTAFYGGAALASSSSSSDGHSHPTSIPTLLPPCFSRYFQRSCGFSVSPFSPSTDVAVSLSAPLRQFLSSTSELFLRDFTLPSLLSSPPGGFSIKQRILFFPVSLLYLLLFFIGQSLVLNAGIFTRYSSTSPLPDSNSYREPFGKNRDDAPCCPGCLGRNSIAEAAAAAGPAVVNISVVQGEDASCFCFRLSIERFLFRSYLKGNFWQHISEGLYGPMFGKSIGSGTIIDPDGTILTCAHCVANFHSMRRVSKGKVGA